MDGMEITQFTYFQQAGGIDLSPITAEITYGLERIAMFLAKVNSIYDVMWNETLSYGEVRRPDEVELSRYGFEVADVELHALLFDRHEAEARRALAAAASCPRTRRRSRARMLSTCSTRGEPSRRRTAWASSAACATSPAPAPARTSRAPGAGERGLAARAGGGRPQRVAVARTRPRERGTLSDFLLEIRTEEIPAAALGGRARRPPPASPRTLDGGGARRRVRRVSRDAAAARS